MSRADWEHVMDLAQQESLRKKLRGEQIVLLRKLVQDDEQTLSTIAARLGVRRDKVKSLMKDAGIVWTKPRETHC